jgi:DNA ligase-3
MADSADLVVLGAYFGTGAYGGMMSVFLMGSYDTDEEKWKVRPPLVETWSLPCPYVQLTFRSMRDEQTVCKVGNGFDDAALKQLQKLLRPQMKQIFKSYDKVPSWLDISR